MVHNLGTKTAPKTNHTFTVMANVNGMVINEISLFEFLSSVYFCVFLNKLNCLVFQIKNLKWKKANVKINTNEKAMTKDNQSPFNNAG
jgi:hypothetical protein